MKRMQLRMLRNIIVEAMMSDDEKRRVSLSRDPQNMDPTEAIDEFISMVGPNVEVHQQSNIKVFISINKSRQSANMLSPEMIETLQDEISSTLVDELGYVYEPSEQAYRRANVLVNISGFHKSNGRDGFELQFVNDVQGNPPQKINIATVATISPAAFDAAKKLISDDDDVLEEKVFWTLSSPNDTNENELRDWLTDEWEKFAIDHDGNSIVLFYGDSVDDEYGNMWSESEQEWHNYTF